MLKKKLGESMRRRKDKKEQIISRRARMSFHGLDPWGERGREKPKAEPRDRPALAGGDSPKETEEGGKRSHRSRRSGSPRLREAGELERDSTSWIWQRQGFW